MPWLQFRLHTDASLAGECEDELLARGAVAVTLEDDADQPLFHGEAGVADGEPRLWQATRVTGLFPAATDTAEIWRDLPEPLRERCTHRTELLEDRDWEREWMQNYRPRRFGTRLWLCPSWLAPPDPAAINLLLDPGLAFGTGTHPTTAMCLEELATMEPIGHTIVDYGCGSGILGIAALLLGAEVCYAVDNDGQALAATAENGRRNGLDDQRLRIFEHGKLPGDIQADLVVANILAGPLRDLAGLLCGHLKPGGTLLLSGLLADQASSLGDAYGRYLPLDVARREGDWIALRGCYNP